MKTNEITISKYIDAIEFQKGMLKTLLSKNYKNSIARFLRYLTIKISTHKIIKYTRTMMSEFEDSLTYENISDLYRLYEKYGKTMDICSSYFDHGLNYHCICRLKEMSYDKENMAIKVVIDVDTDIIEEENKRRYEYVFSTYAANNGVDIIKYIGTNFDNMKSDAPFRVSEFHNHDTTWDIIYRTLVLGIRKNIIASIGK